MSIFTRARLRGSIAVGVMGSLVPLVANAQQPPPAYPPPPPTTAPVPYEPVPPPPDELPRRAVSLTFSPLHLILPVFEASLEVAAGRKVGVSVIGGYGSISAAVVDGAHQSFGVYEIGGQLRYYVTGSFERGLHLGIEALYLHVQADDIVGSGIAATGTGLSIGPLVGYKLTTRGGFTFEAQGGIAYLAVQAEAHDSTDSANAEQNTFGPIVNLNIGWSF